MINDSAFRFSFSLVAVPVALSVPFPIAIHVTVHVLESLCICPTAPTRAESREEMFVSDK